MASVSVTINGKIYRMACDEGQEAHLVSLAERLDSHVSELKGSFGEIGDQRLTVMAGVMVTDKLVELEAKSEKLEAELIALKEKSKSTESDLSSIEEETANGIAELADRISAIAGKLSGNSVASK